MQKFRGGDSIVPYSGILPNSPILYKSPIIYNVSNNATKPIEIDVPGKFVVDKNMVLNRMFTINLMAKDTSNVIYSLQSSLESEVSFGLQKESFSDNTFILVCNLFSSVEFDCDFE